MYEKKWPHPIPPYGRIIVSKGFLTENAVFSDYAREKCDWVKLEEPVYGFSTPPRLISLEQPSLKDYLTYRNKILVEPRWTQNDKLFTIYCCDNFLPKEEFDLFQ